MGTPPPRRWTTRSVLLHTVGARVCAFSVATLTPSNQGPDPGNIWGDFQEMIMRQGGNRGADFSSGGGGGARFDPASLR